MLVLTRKKEEGIVIDDNIEITIISIEGDKVKLGISAPKNKTILRKELYLQAQEENKAAAFLDKSNFTSLQNLFKKKL